MRLFTSRWQNRELAELRCQPVGISRGVPRFRTGYRYRLVRELAPENATWAEETEEGFTASYRRQLEKLGVEEITGRLERISWEAGNLPVVCLCYEREDQFCHRHVLRGWLIERGAEIKELEPGDLPQREDVAQRSLF